jgi:hypothetical protein
VSKQLERQYIALKTAAASGLGSSSVSELLVSMVSHASSLVSASRRLELSSANGKWYIGFEGTHSSRPVNAELFAISPRDLDEQIELFRTGFSGVDSSRITRAVYTMAMMVFVANDIFEVGRKASATYFEILIGHIVARLIGVNPRKKVKMPESQTELSTDYVFDLGPGRGKVHLPLKTSTRERAVQAWVHQLILDRIFGTATYRGILVVCNETKRNIKTGEVVEICVPKQLQIFQSRVAELTRVYYLDPPAAYLALASSFPKVVVKSFGEMFSELLVLLQV